MNTMIHLTFFDFIVPIHTFLLWKYFTPEFVDPNKFGKKWHFHQGCIEF